MNPIMRADQWIQDRVNAMVAWIMHRWDVRKSAIASTHMKLTSAFLLGNAAFPQAMWLRVLMIGFSIFYWWTSGIKEIKDRDSEDRGMAYSTAPRPTTIFWKCFTLWFIVQALVQSVENFSKTVEFARHLLNTTTFVMFFIGYYIDTAPNQPPPAKKTLKSLVPLRAPAQH